MSETIDGETRIGIPDEIEKKFDTYKYDYSFADFADMRIYKDNVEVVKAQKNADGIWNIELNLSNIGKQIK